MGRRKSFINKKCATTYSLLYGDKEDEPQANEDARFNDAAENQTELTPLPVEELAWDLSDIKRKEIVELGLPDDGYDYLQHLKDPVSKVLTFDNANAPAVEGPRVFLPAPHLEPPPEDIKYVDARSLPQQTTTTDVDILQLLGGVAPFARDLDEQPSNRANHVDALNEIMRKIEDADDDADDPCIGDLSDDFVSTAAAKVTFSAMNTAREASYPNRAFAEIIDEEDKLSEQSESSENPDDDEHGSRLGRAYVGSISSTYWRPERRDRGGLATLDERFEQLALEYDSDELGELDDVEGGGAVLELFGALLKKSMAEQPSRVPLVEGVHPAQLNMHAAKASDRHSDDDDARIAVKKARELLHASLLDEGTRVPIADIRGDGTLKTRTWDCESVLTMQSNLDNHPSVLEEPVSSRKSTSRASAGVPADRNVPSSGDERASSGEHQGSEQVDACAAGKQVMQRSKGETPEEKRQRKELVKLAKKEARAIKKDTKIMHKISRCRAASNVGPSQRIVPLSS